MNESTVRRESLWSAPYVLMLAVSLLVSTGHYMLMSTLPLYAVKLSGNNAMAGLMVTLLTISALLFRPFFGNLMDRRGRKIVLVTGAAILMAVSLLYNLIVMMSLILIIRFVQGMGFSAHTTSSGTIIADIVPPARLSEGIGYYGMANTIATAIGPAVGLGLMEKYGYKTLFICVFILSIASFVSTLLVNYEKRPGKTESSGRAAVSGNPITAGNVGNTGSPEKAPAGKREPFLEVTSLRPSLVMFFIAIVFGGIITYIPAFGIARKIENIGVFFTVYALAVLAARSFTGRIADRHGFTMVMIPAMISLCLSMVILAFGRSLPVVLLAGAFFGFGYGTTYPLTNAIIIRLCPPARKGAATATIFASMDIGIGLGAMVWGWVNQLSGFTAVYLACGGCVVISLWVYMAIVRPSVYGNEAS